MIKLRLLVMFSIIFLHYVIDFMNKLCMHVLFLTFRSLWKKNLNLIKNRIQIYYISTEKLYINLHLFSFKIIVCNLKGLYIMNYISSELTKLLRANQATITISQRHCQFLKENSRNRRKILSTMDVFFTSKLVSKT